MKVLSVIGARPQFIKAASVSRALHDHGYQEVLVHTGQHYDHDMSQVFFAELGLQHPHYNLGVGSGTHAWQIGQMLMRLDDVMQQVKPDWVLVYGDTNSTLAGALAACKLRIRLAHVEAGLRSFNRDMPEEHNRVLTDHCADLLLCPTATAVDNLAREGVTLGVHLTGDVMYDSVLLFSNIAQARSSILTKIRLAPKSYLLATIHRAYNTDAADRLSGILEGLDQLSEKVIMPLHPRTQKALSRLGWTPPANVRVLPPVGYLDMLVLEQNARLILTDSGGVQKEAYMFGVPCVTLRPETEWLETVQAGWNVLVDADPNQIVKAVRKHDWPLNRPPVFGNGRASVRVAQLLDTSDSKP